MEKPTKRDMIQRVLEFSERLTLPNLSNLLGVGRLRYIQSIYETGEYRNPDVLVRDFLPPLLRWLSLLQARMQLFKMRSSPFYYYLVARTKYYDEVFVDAIADGLKYIINVGCGSDTRAYRFAEHLTQRKINVLECDQAQCISIKEQLAKRKWPADNITYLSVDLNDGSWPDLEQRLAEIRSAALVVLEGVSPYIDKQSFEQFLKMLAVKLHAGSRIAYDYKIRGIDDDFGVTRRSKRPFQLSATKKDVIAYHETFGYTLQHMESSSELTSRLLPKLVSSGARLFTEDCLLILTIAHK